MLMSSSVAGPKSVLENWPTKERRLRALLDFLIVACGMRRWTVSIVLFKSNAVSVLSELILANNWPISKQVLLSL